MYEEVNEPIEVVSLFKGGKAQPLIFRWRSHLYKIQQVNFYHKVTEGKDLIHAFSVSSEQEGAFKISFNPNSLVWRLNQIYD